MKDKESKCQTVFHGDRWVKKFLTCTIKSIDEEKEGMAVDQCLR